MDELLTSIGAKKKRHDELQPLLPKVLANLEHAEWARAEVRVNYGNQGK